MKHVKRLPGLRRIGSEGPDQGIGDLGSPFFRVSSVRQHQAGIDHLCELSKNLCGEEHIAAVSQDVRKTRAREKLSPMVPVRTSRPSNAAIARNVQRTWPAAVDTDPGS